MAGYGTVEVLDAQTVRIGTQTFREEHDFCFRSTGPPATSTAGTFPSSNRK
ncbi:MAG: hypothetical protein U0361_02080 [Nitrospiraceae bacterium]